MFWTQLLHGESKENEIFMGVVRLRLDTTDVPKKLGN